MSLITHTLDEDSSYKITTDLSSLGLRPGDMISILKLDHYFAGDIVIAKIKNKYQIGKLRISDTGDIELVTPQEKCLEVTRISTDAIAGFIQKHNQEIH